MAELTLEQHLSRHIRFLRTSCEAFDKGDRDEAIRIAVSLRVLMHGGGGAPLLDQLGLSSLQLISTSAKIEPNVVACSGDLSSTTMVMQDGQTNAFNEPKLDSGRTRDALPWRDWWNQTVYLLESGPMTRSDIASTAANKEGAHIAPRPMAGYKILQKGFSTVEQVRDGEVIQTIQLEDVHLSDLRQMAHEVLISPDLACYK